MKRRDEVLVGILLTVSILIGIVGTIWLVRGGLSSGYPLYARFPWGQGLKQGQPVLFSGVNVGYVGGFDLRDEGSVVVTMRINPEYRGRIPEGTTATIEPSGFFGDVLIALTPRGPNPQKIAEGDTVPVGTSKPGIASVLARADSIAGNLNDVSRTIELELVQGGGIADIRQTLAGTYKLIAQIGRIAAEQSRELAATNAALRRAVGALDSAAVDSTVRNLRASSANVERMTGELAGSARRLDALLAKADSGGGTAARLLNDPGLYNDVRSLVTRLDSLTIDIKKNPRKYINLEIF